MTTKTLRPATPDEIAAYRAAVAPLIGQREAVEDLRRRMHLYVKSSGIFKQCTAKPTFGNCTGDSRHEARG